MEKLEREGCLPEISRSLGYRLVLKKLIIPETVYQGKNFHFQLTLENIGFASFYNQRPVYLIFREKTTDYQYR